QLRGEEIGGRLALDGTELDQIASDDLPPLAHRAQEAQPLLPGEPTRLRSAHARDVGGIERVEIDRDVDRIPEALEDLFHREPAFTYFTREEHRRFLRVHVIGLLARDAPDADGHGGDAQLAHAAHHARVTQ